MVYKSNEHNKTPEQIALQRIEEAVLTNSTTLDLSAIGSSGSTNGKLTEVPSEIRRLTGLKVLYLSCNQIYSLPPEITKLTQLETINLQDNNLFFLPLEVTKLINLKSLNLYGNSISVMPKEIENLTSLTSLNIAKNEFIDFPTEILSIPNLTSIVLQDNKLTKLTPKVAQLRKLTSLNLDGNPLNGLPPEISLLPNLTSLNIASIGLTKIPPEIFQLKKIKSLNFHGNNITLIQEEIAYLINLISLNFYGNKISKIPPSFGELINLTYLNLGSNKLTSLPIELLKLRKLSKLELRHNPLQMPPELLEKNTNPKAIFAYYFAGERKSLNEVKLLIVGQGAVGKTSILSRIINNVFDSNQPKTEGISINQWAIDNRQQATLSAGSNQSSIKLNIWDFGGQEIMHATHQFFLTKRSLYLLVLDARLTQEENRVEYWLKIIQSFGGESPVLIVGNKTDQHPLDIDRTGLQKKYPNIVGILETSAVTGAGIEALKDEITKRVDTLPHVRDFLPEAWFTIKSEMEELGREKNFITQDEYLSLCRANDVTDETSQNTLIGFLHDLGVVLHFQDDPRLEALGILNPQWVTNGVYKILNSHELFQNQGTLTLGTLHKILNLPEYPGNKRLFIVDMMKKFELCYDIETDNTFLIPDLLPKDEPYTGEWNDALAFQIHYNVLPSSIISRFIVRMNAFIHKNTIWRSGVVLKSGDNTALVKADAEDRKINIWVSGELATRREFLAVIRAEFAAIHKTIAKIEAIEKVPLPDAPDSTPIDLEFLQKLASEGRDKLPVQVGNQIIDLIVKEVLSHIEKDGGRNIDVGGNVSDSPIVTGNNNVINITQKPSSKRKSAK